MAIFSEIYGVYFRIAGKLLEQERLTEQKVLETVRKEGFRDSVLFLPQKLLPQKDGSDWGLFRRMPDGTLSPVTKHKPPHLLTNLQKRWLLARLDDPRMALFLTEESRKALRERLADVQPLYHREQFRCTDQFTDGDNYADAVYQQKFRIILRAVRRREVLKIAYQSGRRNMMYLRCIPVRLEYSEKNDKFRAYCMEMRGNRVRGSIILNLGRIRSVRETGEFRKKAFAVEHFFDRLRCKSPAVVRVLPERNGVERFLMEFASYEKCTERNTETGCCTVQLWYDRKDETELLIRLLSFGPVLEVLGPPDFRSKAAERIRRQCELMADFQNF